MNLNVLLVSLVPQSEELFVGAGKEKNIQIFESALESTSVRTDEYSLKIYIYDKVNGFMAGLISKKSKVSLHSKDFRAHEEDDFPPVVWFWDRKEQVILIENKTKVFANANIAAKAFEKISNNVQMIESGFRAHIHPKLEVTAFWESYREFLYVNQVQFNLTAPNLFGDTKKEIGDFLHEVVNETNASEFSPLFKNTDGNLTLKPSKWLDAMIDWVAEGAGSWAIKGRRSLRDHVSTASSNRSARIIRVTGNDITELQLENYSATDVQGIIEVFREKYTYKK